MGGDILGVLPFVCSLKSPVVGNNEFLPVTRAEVERRDISLVPPQVQGPLEGNINEPIHSCDTWDQAALRLVSGLTSVLA